LINNLNTTLKDSYRMLRRRVSYGFKSPTREDSLKKTILANHDKVKYIIPIFLFTHWIKRKPDNCRTSIYFHRTLMYHLDYMKHKNIKQLMFLLNQSGLLEHCLLMKLYHDHCRHSFFKSKTRRKIFLPVSYFILINFVKNLFCYFI